MTYIAFENWHTFRANAARIPISSNCFATCLIKLDGGDGLKTARLFKADVKAHGSRKKGQVLINVAHDVFTFESFADRSD